MAIHVRDHFTGDIALALGCKPTDDVAFESLLGEHFPEGRAFAGGSRDRDDRPRLRIDFGEARDAVVVSHLARGDRGPEHWR